ncbi:MAG: DUF4004 family protein [Clostridia bacterium]|nr:DUF4004 family protein [Clostridia bacterium]
MQISKRELLQMTGISYGQLYRWKREGLIPEEWFMKQSAFTGQETFFDRDKILPRIRAILELKEQYSLEELAKRFNEETNPPPAPQTLSDAELPLSPTVKLILRETYPDGSPYPAALLAAALTHLTEALLLPLPDLRALTTSALAMANALAPESVTGMSLTLWRSERPRYLLTLSAEGGMIADPRLEEVASVPLAEIATAISLKLNNNETNS